MNISPYWLDASDTRRSFDIVNLSYYARAMEGQREHDGSHVQFWFNELSAGLFGFGLCLTWVSEVKDA